MTHDRDERELGGIIAALARRFPREVQPPAELWGRIAARLEPLDEADRLAASLPTQIDPPKDLWPDIESRIAPHRRTRRAALAFAAIIVAAAAVAIGIRLVSEDSGPDRTAPLMAGDTATAGDSAGNLGWVLGAPALAGDVAANLSRELALVREQRLSIERAIAMEPDNVDLRELWAFAYETELELADAIGRTVMEYQRVRG